MKQLILKGISTSLCGVFIVTLLSSTSIAANIKSNDNQQLAEMGIPAEIIEVIPERDVQDLIIAYQADKNSVSVDTSTLEVDVLAEMEEFAKNTDLDLLKKGFTRDQIIKGRSIINSYNNSSDAQLLNDGLKQNEIDSLRDALDPEKESSPRSAISLAKLTFTSTAADYSGSSNVHYFIGIYFNWKTPYMWNIYEDKIAVAWGGDLRQNKVGQAINYYKTNATHTKFTEFAGGGVASYSEQSVNAGGVYRFPQSYSKVSLGESGDAKEGSFRYEIQQNGKMGKQSKAIATYAHQVAQFTGGISVNMTGVTPSIAVGSGYDEAFTEADINV